MHDIYGIDVDDDDLLRRRSWRWLRVRINGLINRPPIIAPDGTVIPSTRIGLALEPPQPAGR